MHLIFHTIINPFHVARGPQQGFENVPYLWLPDPIRDYVQLQVTTGNSSTDNPMCVNCHQLVLWIIQITFCNPWPWPGMGPFQRVLKKRLYKNPPPYFTVLASSVKTKEVKVIEFHRIFGYVQKVLYSENPLFYVGTNLHLSVSGKLQCKITKHSFAF